MVGKQETLPEDLIQKRTSQAASIVIRPTEINQTTGNEKENSMTTKSKTTKSSKSKKAQVKGRDLKPRKDPKGGDFSSRPAVGILKAK